MLYGNSLILKEERRVGIGIEQKMDDWVDDSNQFEDENGIWDGAGDRVQRQETLKGTRELPNT